MKMPLLFTTLLCSSICFIADAATQKDLEAMFGNIVVRGYCISTSPYHLNEALPSFRRIRRKRDLSLSERYLSWFLALIGGNKYFQVNIYEPPSVGVELESDRGNIFAKAPGITRCYRGTVDQLLEKIDVVTAAHEKLRYRLARWEEKHTKRPRTTYKKRRLPDNF